MGQFLRGRELDTFHQSLLLWVVRAAGGEDDTRVVREMRAKMELFPEFRDAFYIHDMRGVKGGSVHDPANVEDRKAAMNETCEYLAMDQIPPDQFYIDVGLEIRRPGHVVQWEYSAHNALVGALLPNASPLDVGEILERSSCRRDPNALLTDFAGLRVPPGRYGAADGVKYINIYTTDKSVHYQLHRGVFRKHSPEDLMPENLARLMKDVDMWTESLYECMGGDEDRSEQEGAARCEVRVPIAQYDAHLTGWNEEFVRRVVSAVPCRSWWYVPHKLTRTAVALIGVAMTRMFKWNRAMACYYVLDVFASTPGKNRQSLESLALGAEIVYT